MKPIDKYIKSGRAAKMWKLGEEYALKKMEGSKEVCQMMKIDYEGAWKGLKEHLSKNYITDERIMEVVENFEQKHTHNYVDIRKRSDKEIADYCLKKHAEMYLELVELKSKLKELSKGGCNG